MRKLSAAICLFAAAAATPLKNSQRSVDRKSLVRFQAAVFNAKPLHDAHHMISSACVVLRGGQLPPPIVRDFAPTGPHVKFYVNVTGRIG